MQVTNKTILSLDDRSSYTFETSKKTNNCFFVKKFIVNFGIKKTPTNLI